ncbi:MAG: hypothetical protein KAR15_16695 [Desulfobacterales bacterium]|nr:hypothetical protein [Desulfobacterales bacterium]
MAISKQKEETKIFRTKKAANHLIGTLGEKSLHAALKAWYSRPGDHLEKIVDGFHIDIVRSKLLIEIQTQNFSSIKNKLTALTKKHQVRLVFPMAQEKWIVRLAADGITQLGRRKSPKKGNLFQLFEELVSIPSLIQNANFSFEVLLIREEEIRRDDGLGSWRRKGWSIADHRFLEVVSKHVFKKSSDFLSLMPPRLSDPFSTHDLAEAINQPRWLAQKMAYCLRKMGVIEMVGKKRNSVLYSTPSKFGS